MEFPIPPAENRILRSLPASDLAALQSCLKRVALVQGAALYETGGAIEHVHFPITGMVSLLTLMKSGQEIETGIIGKSGIVGALIGNGGALALGQATVQVEGSAWQMPRAKFQSMLDNSARLRSLTNEFEGYMYFQAQQCAACYAVHAVEARLCRWLLQCQDVTQSDVIPLTQENLSQMMGVQRNAVSLCAHQLQLAGLVQYSRGTIRIVSREGLESSACECYEAIRDYGGRMAPPLLHEANPLAYKREA